MFISAGILIQAFGDELDFVQAEVNIQGTVLVFWYVHTDFIFLPICWHLAFKNNSW